MIGKAEELRNQAKKAGKSAGEAKSLRASATARKRQKGLNQLADNEDWLEGKPKPESEGKSYSGL